MADPAKQAQPENQVMLRTNTVIETIQSQRNQALDQVAGVTGELAVQNSTIRVLSEENAGLKMSLSTVQAALAEAQSKLSEANAKIVELEVRLATKDEQVSEPEYEAGIAPVEPD